MTIPELKANIRYRTNQLNIELYDHPEYKDNYAVSQAITKLQGVGAKGRNGNTVGLGFKSGRSRESYVRQLRELDFAVPLVTDYEGRQYLEEKYNNSYNKFSTTHPEISKEDWRDMVETFGAVGKSLVDEFGSDNIVDLFTDKSRSIDMVGLMKKAKDNMKGKSASQQDMVDEFMKLMANELNVSVEDVMRE
jgi:hypothetical protein